MALIVKGAYAGFEEGTFKPKDDAGVETGESVEWRRFRVMDFNDGTVFDVAYPEEEASTLEQLERGAQIAANVTLSKAGRLRFVSWA